MNHLFLIRLFSASYGQDSGSSRRRSERSIREDAGKRCKRPETSLGSRGGCHHPTGCSSDRRGTACVIVLTWLILVWLARRRSACIIHGTMVWNIHRTRRECDVCVGSCWSGEGFEGGIRQDNKIVFIRIEFQLTGWIWVRCVSYNPAQVVGAGILSLFSLLPWMGTG